MFIPGEAFRDGKLDAGMWYGIGARRLAEDL
jgi:hypothetical protein